MLLFKNNISNINEKDNLLNFKNINTDKIFHNNQISNEIKKRKIEEFSNKEDSAKKKKPNLKIEVGETSNVPLVELKNEKYDNNTPENSNSNLEFSPLNFQNSFLTPTDQNKTPNELNLNMNWKL